MPNSNAEGEGCFDRTTIELLAPQNIKTSTPWHDNLVTFQGVPIEWLL
ncbi:hypothetical protein [Mesorhizobium sp.]|nr:hypothetical protein [Mesorhizobium sp.]